MANEAATQDRDTTTIGVFRDQAKQLKQIADHYGITIAEALERYAGKAILHACKRAVKEFQEALELGESGA